MDLQKRALITIHICVALWGFTAILGALITIQSIPLVMWRALMSGIMMAAIAWMQGWQTWPGWVWRRCFLIGAIVGIHWVFFYSSIKLANASVGVVTISTASFFTAILSPILAKTEFKWLEVTLGLLIIPSILLIVGHVDLGMQKGFWVGICAAALVGLFTPLIGRLVAEYPSINVIQASAVQMFTVFVLVAATLPVFLYLNPEEVVAPEKISDWTYIFLLASFCTVLPFTMSMYAQRFISAFTSTLILNLEPVYGIILAILILREDRELNFWFYVGVTLLFAVVFGHALYLRRSRKKSQMG